ncbi:MAG: PAS domain S-box protein [Ketobacter sp.]|nr:MAG: PAS domain S-box protein [Ketobacter sp.]
MNQHERSTDLNSSRKPSVDRSSQPPMHWPSSLRFKLAIGLFVLFLVLIASNLWLIWYRGLPLLVQQHKDLQRQIGENIVTELSVQFLQAETLTKDIANLMETVTDDYDGMRDVIPKLLDLESLRGVIAGGGIWPEPFRVDANQERASLFWGRTADNNLTFFDDYNRAEGPGYHHEEWYVPATYLDDGNAYWSRSYTDPYSLQPMVTCSVPIYQGLALQGVATVDLKLEGLTNLVAERIGERRGYAFVIDRNNKFISFPDPAMVVTARQDQRNRVFTDFIYIDELATQLPVFRPVADRLNFLSHQSSTIVNRDAEQIKDTAKQIAERSYQIGLPEARLIAHNLFRNSDRKIRVLDNFETEDDILLHGHSNVTVYTMPHTHWKVVTVFPVQDSVQAALNISQSVTLGSITIIVIWGTACAVFLWNVLFSRLQDMTARIRQSAQDGRELPLDLGPNDELGQLAQWYNHRTRQLNQALKSAEVSTQNLKRENNEHKTTAKLLERSLSMQRAILDSANLAVITMDKEGRIQNCNSGAIRLLGFKEHELAGRTFPHCLIDRVQLEAFQSAIQQRYDVTISGFRLFTTALEQGEDQDNQWLFTCRDGTLCRVKLSITAVINQQHVIEGWLAVIAALPDPTENEPSAGA